MPKNSSASLRAKVREYAAQHGTSYVAAHAKLTTPADVTSAADVEETADQDLYRIADRDNRGWLYHPDIGLWNCFDPTGSMPRPLPDAQLAELAVHPGWPTLDVEQVAAVVELLPLGRRWVSTAEQLAERLNSENVTTERIELIIERIATEKSERYGHPVPKFDLDRQSITPRPLEEIERHFGPSRPVKPMTQADDEDLREAFDLAGRKLITSVVSALEQVWHEARERFGSWRTDPSGTGNYAQRTLTAGRPGSWEAECVMPLVWFGNELNLHPYKRSLPVETMRATGPSPRRVHVQARDQIAAVLRRWTNSPDRYTEVPETLAGFISSYADDKHGAEGWRRIADQWLQPGGMAQENFTHCYRLLYSTSEHFDVDLI